MTIDDLGVDYINEYIAGTSDREIMEGLVRFIWFKKNIGEAKRTLENNGSPELFYKVFDTMDNVTSVVIPVCEEYKEIKEGAKPNKKLGIEGQSQDIKQKILGSGYSRATKQNIIRIYEEVGTEIFGNSRIVEILDCSETTATTQRRMECNRFIRLLSFIKNGG